MEAYFAGDFTQALALLQATEALEQPAAVDTMTLSHIYQERCRYLLAHPPMAWDGVWTLTSKERRLYPAP